MSAGEAGAGVGRSCLDEMGAAMADAAQACLWPVNTVSADGGGEGGVGRDEQDEAALFADAGEFRERGGSYAPAHQQKAGRETCPAPGS